MINKLRSVNLDPVLHYALKKMANSPKLDTTIVALVEDAVWEKYKNDLIEWIILAEEKYGRKYKRQI